YWYNRNVVRRSVPPTQTMDDGTYWHELARHALVPSANTPDPEPLNDAQRAMHAFMPTALAELTRDWDVVEIERPHAIKLGARWGSRPDCQPAQLHHLELALPVFWRVLRRACADR